MHKHRSFLILRLNDFIIFYFFADNFKNCSIYLIFLHKIISGDNRKVSNGYYKIINLLNL